MLKNALLITALSFGLGTISEAEAARHVPGPKTVKIMKAKAHAKIWVPGHFVLNLRLGKLGWVSGTWKAPPRQGSHWVPGHWQGVGKSKHWIAGRWS
jgi:hypothetical protein